jgi:hypothetical protein
MNRPRKIELRSEISSVRGDGIPAARSQAQVFSEIAGEAHAVLLVKYQLRVFTVKEHFADEANVDEIVQKSNNHLCSLKLRAELCCRSSHALTVLCLRARRQRRCLVLKCGAYWQSRQAIA